MKVFLIFPPQKHNIYGISPYSFMETEVGAYAPVGLLYIAAYLQSKSDCEVRVIDCVAGKIGHEELKEIVAREKPDLAGIYASTHYLNDTHIASSNVRQASRGTLIVVGGPHVTLYREKAFQIPDIDIAVAGEGEITFERIVQKCLYKENSIELEKIPGVITKQNLSSYANPVYTEDLDSLPFPARNLITIPAYRSIITKGNPTTTIISSRGCPYRCKFCSNLESNQKVRYRSAGNVIDEMQQCKDRYGIRDFLFFDELFTLSKSRVLSLCDEMIRRDLKVRWHCRSRADLIDEEMVRRMKNSGCRMIQFGIETGSQRLQKTINKNLDLNKVRETVAMVHDNGIYTFADFMFGLPTETEEERQSTLEFAKSLKLDYGCFGVFGPIPGSDFYEEGKRDGVFPDYWGDYILDPTRCVHDYSWSRRDIDAYHPIVGEFFKQFYLRPSYLIRRIVRMDSFSQMAWLVKSGIKLIVNLLVNLRGNPKKETYSSNRV